MSDHVIKRGLDIPIKGQASGQPVQLPPPPVVAYTPTELRGTVPKPAVREGDSVKAGSILFYHKPNPKLVFRSPIAGTVKEIRRGHRRVITDFIIERSGEGEERTRAHTAAELSGLGREQALEACMATGLWGTLRTRPLDQVADPAVVPQAIFIVGTETGPLQPGPSVLLGDGDAEPLQAAINALSKLTEGRVHLTMPGGGHPVLSKLQGVTTHTFSGPHPSGDPTVQVNLVEPVRGTNRTWWIRAWDAADMGRALLTGAFPAERVYAAVGAGCKAPRFVRTVLGAPLSAIVGEVNDGEMRWIRGSVLTGQKVSPDSWGSYWTRAVHVLPEKVERELAGWALPNFGRWSFHAAYLLGLLNSKPAEGLDLRPGLYGGHRAIVPVGYYSDVIASPDILLDYLTKAILAGDIEEAMELGLLDLSEEEAALATYICPSKIEFGEILREGLAAYEAET